MDTYRCNDVYVNHLHLLCEIVSPTENVCHDAVHLARNCLGFQRLIRRIQRQCTASLHYLLSATTNRPLMIVLKNIADCSLEKKGDECEITTMFFRTNTLQSHVSIIFKENSEIFRRSLIWKVAPCDFGHQEYRFYANETRRKKTMRIIHRAIKATDLQRAD